jgi:RNA polymerase sigma factor (sigma-70 family)
MKDPGENPRSAGSMTGSASGIYTDKTRSSLLEEIKRLSNASGWRRFHELYAPLIQRFALRSGLTRVESDEVVQNTMLRVVERISEFDYDRERGSFKSWLLKCAKWRILDAIRARPKNTLQLATDGNAGPSLMPVAVFESAWDDEWAEHQKQIALEGVKKKSSAAHFQIFCLYVIDGLSARKVAEMVGVTVAQVYLVRCRLGRMLKNELTALRDV